MTPDRDTFEEYRNVPPTYIAIFLRIYALSLEHVLGHLSETVEVSAENPSSFPIGTRKKGLEIRPKIRPFKSDAVTSGLEPKRASELERTQGDLGCPEHCSQWFCNCASKVGDGELVVPCL